MSSSDGVTLASSGPGSTATDGCYETDCAGTCYGDAQDLACGCNDADSCNDCAGVPNGGSALDDCGVCDGGNTCMLASLSLGSFDSSGSLEVLYDFGGPVAGFQFDVTGLTITGGSGGAAGGVGMTVSAGGATVVGFSFDNSEVAAGNGVLTVLSFSSVTAGTTELSLGNFGAVTDASGNVYTTTASGSVDHGDVDCAGDYYGDAQDLACGCNDADSCNDCAGVPNGDSALDDCGVCDGGNADQDCAGVCFGEKSLKQI